MTKRPAEVFPPGDFLKEELEERGWTQTEFSEITELNQRTISEIISAKRAITPETAIAFGEALGTGPQFWMNLESVYQLSKVSPEENVIARRAKLYERFPVKEMIKRGWIQATQNLEVLETQFMEFFNVKGLDETPVFSHAARKASYEENTMQQVAWLFRARVLAKAAPRMDKFSIAKLDSAFEELKTCLEFVDAIRNTPRILAEAGIRLVILEAIPGSKIDGACFWLSNDEPVIVLSLRYDRVDNFWHTLFHELDHVRHGEGKDAPIMDIDIFGETEGTPLSDMELRANTEAARSSIPDDEMEGFIARVNPFYTDEKIIGFARRIKVHPGIVVGQLQNRHQILFSMHRKHLEKFRNHIVGSALTDGFGCTPGAVL